MILVKILKWQVTVLYSHRRHISLCMVSRHATTLKVLEYKRISVLELPVKLPDINPIEDVWNIIKKEIVNQKRCKKNKIYVEASLLSVVL